MALSFRALKDLKCDFMLMTCSKVGNFHKENQKSYCLESHPKSLKRLACVIGLNTSYSVAYKLFFVSGD